MIALRGGIGSVGGGLVGRLAIGVFGTLWSSCLPTVGRHLAPFAVLVLFTVLRPDRLFGASPLPKATS